MLHPEFMFYSFRSKCHPVQPTWHMFGEDVQHCWDQSRVFTGCFLQDDTSRLERAERCDRTQSTYHVVGSSKYSLKHSIGATVRKTTRSFLSNQMLLENPTQHISICGSVIATLHISICGSVISALHISVGGSVIG